MRDPGGTLPKRPARLILIFMPIYEYLCKKCGRHFEKRQSVSEEPLKMCEECGGQLEKQWSLSGFAFKGEGWYVTDYAGKKGASGGDNASGGKQTDISPESTTSAEGASNQKSEKSTKTDDVKK